MSTDAEYQNYQAAMDRLDALMGKNIPRYSREDYEDMAELLNTRFGVFA
jgi:hypothetical protein